MAEASTASVDSSCEEKGPDGSSAESVPHGTTISRLKLLDTTVDTFLQKLVAVGRYGGGSGDENTSRSCQEDGV